MKENLDILDEINALQEIPLIDEYELIEVTKKNSMFRTWMLKNINENLYLKINEYECFVFTKLIEGNCKEDISKDFLETYRLEKVTFIDNLLIKLARYGFLSKYLYDKTMNKKRSLLEIRIPIKILPPIYEWLYKHIGKYILNLGKKGTVIGVVICLLGILSYAYVVIEQVSLVGQMDLLNTIIFFMVVCIPIFLHELSHALMVIHYKRSVIESGFMIYLFLPVFYVNTNDMWMADRKKRIVVDLIGIICDLLVGSIFAITLLIFMESNIAFILLQGSMLCYMRVILNINPLLKWDGYYALMDILESNNLRVDGNYILKKFIKNIIKLKVSVGNSFKEKILLLYAILSSLYITYFMHRLLTVKAFNSIYIIYSRQWKAININTLFDIVMGIIVIIFIINKIINMVKRISNKFYYSKSKENENEDS